MSKTYRQSFLPRPPRKKRALAGVPPSADPTAANPCTYFIADPENGLIKIGCTFQARLEERAMEIERELGHALTLLGSVPGGRPVEKALHDELQSTRRHGEWFAPSERLSEIIASSTPYIPHVPVPAVTTHCANGHEWTPETTRFWNGMRYCRPCSTINAARSYGYRKAKRARLAAVSVPANGWSPDALAYWGEWVGLL